MRIKSFVSRGELFMHEDGSFELAPFQVFRGSDGCLHIRIGRNCYFFNSDGSYDGPECKLPSDANMDALAVALEQGSQNRGKRPDEAYFGQGTQGFYAEIKSWPSDNDSVEPDSAESYSVMPKPSDKN